MHPSAQKIWTTAQDLLRSILNHDIFNLWFAPIRAVDYSGDSITLEIANDFCEFWLKDNYLSLIQDALATAAGHHVAISFRVAALSMENGKARIAYSNKKEVEEEEEE